MHQLYMITFTRLQFLISNTLVLDKGNDLSIGYRYWLHCDKNWWLNHWLTYFMWMDILFNARNRSIEWNHNHKL